MGYREVVLSDTPVWYGRLGESSGTSANDETGGAAGTYVNTPTLGVTGALTGDANTAATFASASTEHVTIADAARFDFGAGDWSLEIWAKQAAGGQTSDWLFSKGGQFSLFLNSSGRLKTDNFTGTWSVTSDAAVNGDTDWHHYVATRNGSTFTLYRDGASIPATASGTVNLAANAVAVFIGVESSGSSPFNGTLDEPAIYDHALSAARVLAHYTAGRTLFLTGAVSVAPSTAASGSPVVTGTAAPSVSPLVSVTGRPLITGTMALATAPATDASGTTTVTATSAPSVAPSTAASGTSVVTGTAASSVAPSTAATGSPAVAGAMAASVAPSASATGTPVVTGTAASTVTPSTALLGEAQPVTGAMASSVVPQAAASGAPVVTGSVSSSVAAVASATGSGIVTGTVAVAIPMAMTAALGSAVATGAVASSVVPSTAMTGAPPFDWEHATGTVTLSAIPAATVTVSDPAAASVSISSAGSGVVTA